VGELRLRQGARLELPAAHLSPAGVSHSLPREFESVGVKFDAEIDPDQSLIETRSFGRSRNLSSSSCLAFSASACAPVKSPARARMVAFAESRLRSSAAYRHQSPQISGLLGNCARKQKYTRGHQSRSQRYRKADDEMRSFVDGKVASTPCALCISPPPVQNRQEQRAHTDHIGRIDVQCIFCRRARRLATCARYNKSEQGFRLHRHCAILPRDFLSVSKQRKPCPWRR